MLLTKHINPLYIHIFICLCGTFFAINSYVNFNFINSIFYLFIHLEIIYIIIYYYRTLLYIFLFFVGIVLDLSLFNQIGTHTMTFMLIILIMNIFKKFIYKMNAIQIYFFIIFILILVLIFENLISYFLFKNYFTLLNLLEYLLIALIISFPSFYIFKKIDGKN